MIYLLLHEAFIYNNQLYKNHKHFYIKDVFFILKQVQKEKHYKYQIKYHLFLAQDFKNLYKIILIYLNQNLQENNFLQQSQYLLI